MSQWYMYSFCDQWKSFGSMGLVGIFDEDRLKREIVKDLDNGNVELDEGTEPEDIQSMSWKDIEIRLTYGNIQPITLNERT